MDFSLLWNDGDAAVDIDDNYIIRLSITLAQRTLNRYPTELKITFGS